MARKRPDIVLSMTLAETFLLLLFLIWLGNVARESGSQPPQDPNIIKIENARLREENATLRSDVDRLIAEARRLQLIVDAFRNSLGIPTPVNTPAEVPGAVAAADEARRRGAPK